MSQHNHEVYLGAIVGLSVSAGVLPLVGLGFYIISHRRKTRFTVREAMMHREATILRTSVRSLERQLDACTCTKRLPWELSGPADDDLELGFSRGVCSDRHRRQSIRRRAGDAEEWVEFDAGEGPDDIGTAHTTGEQHSDPDPFADSARSPRELRALNRNRVAVLDALPEVADDDHRFVVGDDSDGSLHSLPPRPENPLARTPPPLTNGSSLTSSASAVSRRSRQDGEEVLPSSSKVETQAVPLRKLA